MNLNKNILMFCHVFYPSKSGYSHAFQNIIKAITEDGDVKVTVVTPQELPESINELELENVTVKRISNPSKIKYYKYFYNEYFYAKYVNKEFNNGNYDCLFVETFDRPIFLTMLSKNVLKRTIVRIHSTTETEYSFFENSLDFFIKRNFIRYAANYKIDWVLSTNKYHVSFAKKYYYFGNEIKYAKKNFFVLPNGLDIPNEISDFNFEPKKNYSDEKLKVLTLGRMDELGAIQKGFKDLVQAIRLLDKETLEKYDFSFIGQGSEQIKFKSQLRAYDNVKFIDSLPHNEVMKALQESDVVILPSRFEGLSMFAMEALSTRNVCLFSDTGGLSDLIIDSETGFLFEPQNIEQLCFKLRKISLLNSDEIELIKSKSRDYVVSNYNNKKLKEKFSNVLNLLCDSQ